MSHAVLKGTLFGILSAVAYGLNPFFALPLYKAGMPPESVLLFRYLLATLLLGGGMMLARCPLRLPREQILPTVGGGLLMTISSITLFRSFRIMDSGIAATVLFVYPVMVAVIMAVWFREKITPAIITGIALALGGVLLLCRPAPGAVVCATGIFYALISALTYSFYIVAVRESRLARLPSAQLTFYVMLSGTFFLLVPLRGGLDLMMPPDWRACGWLTGLALLPSVTAFLLLSLAVRFIGATRAAMLGVMEPLTAVVVGICFLAEPFSRNLVFGIVLIFASVLCVIWPPAGKKMPSGAHPATMETH
ncbi:MAG: DMT family transporter [Lentisphaeria bacterium]|nr:DMT family transporter [Lentisphaeria bacterium]